MITIEDIMTASLYTLKASSTIEEASSLMKEKSIRHIPIVNDFGRLLGLVSQRDVMAATSSVAQHHPEDLCTSLTYIMQRKLITIERHCKLAAAARLMRENKIGCLPVLENEMLVGIVTDTDFVTIAIHLVEQLEMVEPLEYEGA